MRIRQEKERNGNEFPTNLACTCDSFSHTVVLQKNFRDENSFQCRPWMGKSAISNRIFPLIAEWLEVKIVLTKTQPEDSYNIFNNLSAWNERHQRFFIYIWFPSARRIALTTNLIKSDFNFSVGLHLKKLHTFFSLLLS